MSNIKVEPETETKPAVSREESPAPPECPDKIPVFKDKNFVVSLVCCETCLYETSCLIQCMKSLLV